jgi:hypothetical protein
VAAGGPDQVRKWRAVLAAAAVDLAEELLGRDLVRPDVAQWYAQHLRATVERVSRDAKSSRNVEKGTDVGSGEK